MNTKQTHLGHTNQFKIDDYKVVTGQVNKLEPWTAYLYFSGYLKPNSDNLNATMTTLERKFRIKVEDVIKKVFTIDQPKFTLKDVQWSDSDHIDLSKVYSYVFFELTFHFSKNVKINIKNDKRFKIVAKEIIDWLVSNNLVSFVAERPKNNKSGQ